MGEMTEHRGTIDGLDTRWFEAPVPDAEAPVLYLHGVPNHGAMWKPFLERTGGFAPDLPGFGDSAKPNGFDYSIEGYREWLEGFLRDTGIDRLSLVVHDWGAVGLALAQQIPDRVERLVIMDSVPFVPGYRWHTLARWWRRPVFGEVAMGFTFSWNGKKLADRSQRTPFSEEAWAETYKYFDHGTQRAILRLYRSAPSEVLARAGEKLGDLTAPALVIWGGNDVYLPTRFADEYAAALGGDATVSIVEGAGHWVWNDEPAVIDQVTAFLRG